MSQLRFACAVQLPLQLAEHFSEQAADGGVAVHCTLQRAAQLPLHWATHSLMFPLDEHCALHPPWQSVSQEPWQSKLPGSTLHIPEQLASHVPVQLTSAVAVQPPVHVGSSWAEHEASKFTSVQLAVQPPEVSRTQFELAVASRLPQALSTAACAGRATKRDAAARANPSVVLAKT
jgi:hypothetical protein